MFLLLRPFNSILLFRVFLEELAANDRFEWNVETENTVDILCNKK